VTTDDPEIERRLRLLRSHGNGGDGSHLLAGTTSRLDAVQAAVLLAKLPYLKGWTEARARNARIYAEELAGCAGIELPPVSPGEEPVWNQYTLRCRRSGPVRAALEGAGIEWRHYYPRPAACELGLGPLRRPRGEFPRAERACAEAVSVPVRPSLGPESVREIAAVIRAAAGGGDF
jgi:dTDP-4-amino-4,6-dideoxygalactose transaminase